MRGIRIGELLVEQGTLTPGEIDQIMQVQRETHRPFGELAETLFGVDPKAIEAAITPRTVGLLPVHLFGLCADMEPILDLARRRHLWVVEDAACALGGRIRGIHAGIKCS